MPVPPFGWKDHGPPDIDAANLEAMLAQAGAYTDALAATAGKTNGLGTLDGEGYQTLTQVPPSVVNGRGLPDYLIRKTGAVIEAINGATGAVAFSSEESALVFQEAISALRGVGGLIAFKGQFMLKAALTVYPGIGLVGQGPLAAFEPRGSILTGPSSLKEPIIKLTYDAEHPEASFPYLGNFTIIGNLGAAGQHGVEISDATGVLADTFLDHVLIFQTGGHGLYHNSESKTFCDGCYLEDCHESGLRQPKGNVQFTNGYVFGNKLFGIDPTSGTYCEVTNSKIWSNEGGALNIWSVAQQVKLLGCNLTNNGGGATPAVLIKDTGASSYAHAMIGGNDFVDSRGGSAVEYFIKGSVNSLVKALIEGNSFQGQSKAPVFITPKSGNRYIIKNNRGLNDTLGKVATPFSTTETRAGIEGTVAEPAAATAYTVDGTDLLVTSTGGEEVSITIKDPAGNTVASGLTTLTMQLVPVGYSINFGAYKAGKAPTVACYVV